jgi:hypothetical protein
MTLGMSMGISGTTFPQSRYIRINVQIYVRENLRVLKNNHTGHKGHIGHKTNKTKTRNRKL